MHLAFDIRHKSLLLVFQLPTRVFAAQLDVMRENKKKNMNRKNTNVYRYEATNFHHCEEKKKTRQKVVQKYIYDDVVLA